MKAIDWSLSTFPGAADWRGWGVISDFILFISTFRVIHCYHEAKKKKNLRMYFSMCSFCTRSTKSP